MKSKNILAILVISVTLMSCQSPSKQIKDAFETVNNSIKESNSILDNSNQEIYSSIQKLRGKNEMIARMADTIFFANLRAYDYIDSLKDILMSRDSAGSNLELATKLLVSTPSGERLEKFVLDVYSSVASYPVSSEAKNRLDSTLQMFVIVKTNKNLMKTYFEGTPTVGAITILNKIQSDCQLVASITLSDIRRRLGK